MRSRCIQVRTAKCVVDEAKLVSHSKHPMRGSNQYADNVNVVVQQTVEKEKVDGACVSKLVAWNINASDQGRSLTTTQAKLTSGLLERSRHNKA
jgi:hypothetical protein